MKTKKIILLSAMVIVMNASYAQESCDSTCNAAISLKDTNKTLKKSNGKINHKFDDYVITYEYQTLNCPAGYQGRGGAAGSINERRTIVKFNNGNTEIGEWIALNDNCEVIPTPPPPPPPPPAPAGPICNEYKSNLTTWMGASPSINSTVANVANMPGSQCASVPPYIARSILSENPSLANWCMGFVTREALPSWVTQKTYANGDCYSNGYPFIIYK